MIHILKLINKTSSDIDKTIKYDFDYNGQVIEFSYIDNGSNKDIICVPCQTMCNMKCKFCHLTDYIGKIKLNNLPSDIIYGGVNKIIKDLDLGKRPLLISYMGCGEPLNNLNAVIDSMVVLKNKYKHFIRFGLATMLPKKNWLQFYELTSQVITKKLPLKIHLSLHFTNDSDRYKWMPSAWDIESSLEALKFYKKHTNNPTEIHYTLMEGVNDTLRDVELLNNENLIDRETTIKFMMFSPKETLEANKVNTDSLKMIVSYLKDKGSIVEYYEPPGESIGSSCGMFLTDL